MSRIRQAVLLFCLASCLAIAAPAGEGDTLITDPALLTRLGFPSDARNVYLAKGAVLDQKSSSAAPEEFGTADFGWTTVLGEEHIGDSTAVYTRQLDGSIFCDSGPGTLKTRLHMPSGALFKQVTWFGLDESAYPTKIVGGSIYRVCQTGFPTIGPPVITILGSADSPDTGDFIFTVSVPAGEFVSNFSCAYSVRTYFGFGPGADNDLVLRKIRAGWQRQVSAAPLNATFPNDTPTTHPYFRFIEALAVSGITAGCGPGSFCPNNPITRGEMAVFLSVALGLHSPN